MASESTAGDFCASVLAARAHLASQLDDLSFQLDYASGVHGGQTYEFDDRGATLVLAGKGLVELLEILDEFLADNGNGIKIYPSDLAERREVVSFFVGFSSGSGTMSRAETDRLSRRPVSPPRA